MNTNRAESGLNVRPTPEQIKDVNDFIRKNIFTYANAAISKDKFPGLERDINTKLILTRSVSSMGDDLKPLLMKISEYDKFEEGDDPYGEHDFGSVSFKDSNYFFKFDYYDNTYNYGEVNGNRVLTIMHSSEY